MGAQKNRLIETVLLSTHNRIWFRNKKIIFLLRTLNLSSVHDNMYVLSTLEHQYTSFSKIHSTETMIWVWPLAGVTTYVIEWMLQTCSMAPSLIYTVSFPLHKIIQIRLCQN